MNVWDIPQKQFKILKKLNTPVKIQDFLDKMPINFEKNGETCLSPLLVLKKGICHCIEAAVLAALALRINGQPPLILDLTAIRNDFDHVITVFKKREKWGAISKTNHAVLRYREPVYNSIRELVMSYFHEYQDNYGHKNLRSYSWPVNLKRFDKLGWMTTYEEIGYIPEYLVKVKHYHILTRTQIRNLRLADPIEIKAGRLIEWKGKMTLT